MGRARADGGSASRAAAAAVRRSAPLIAYLAHRFPAATETFTYDEVVGLRAAGLDVVVHAFRRGEELGWLLESVPVRCLPTTSGPYVAALTRWAVRRPRRLIRCAVWALFGSYPAPPTLRERRANLLALPRAAVLAELPGVDLYHAQFANEAATVALLASHLSGRPFSFRTHTEPRPQLLREKLRRAAVVLTISDDDTTRLRALEPAARIVPAPLGVTLPASPAVAREQGLIVSVGSLIEKKGHDVLVDAVARLVREGRAVRCEIAGAGEQEEPLRRRVAEAGLDGIVVLRGHLPRDEVAVLLSRAAVFALASKPSDVGTDGVPVVLLEALARGTPCVSTRLAGIPEVVRDGDTGLLVRPGDAEAFAGALGRLLDDPALAGRLAESGRELVRSERDATRCHARAAEALTAAAGIATDVGVRQPGFGATRA